MIIKESLYRKDRRYGDYGFDPITIGAVASAAGSVLPEILKVFQPPPPPPPPPEPKMNPVVWYVLGGVGVLLVGTMVLVAVKK